MKPLCSSSYINTFNVIESNLFSDSPITYIQESPDTNECFQNTGIIVIVLTCCIAGILCGAALVYIIMRTRRSKKEVIFDNNGCNNKGYKNKI